tara:strand:- start:11309 stop:13228 length:1920 start_codon:yes stop_codon:yes gene_type:complete
MALVVKDRVKETTSTTGTGTLTLGGAVTGFQTFTSVLSNSDTTYYAIFESSTGQFEVGLGTFTSSGTTLARTTILESSNSGNAINLTAGAADVFITQPAEKAVYLDASGHIATADGRNVTNVAASTATTAGTVTTAAQPNITSLGTLTTLTVDELTINADTITATDDFVIDAAADIKLDANGGFINFFDDGTPILSFANSSTDAVIQSRASDRDMIFKGNDGGSTITALTLDMSDGGTAIFNHDVKMGDLQYLLMGDGNDLELVGDGTNGKIAAANGNLLLDVSGEIHLDADSGIIRIRDAGGDIGMLRNESNDFTVRSMVGDADLLFKGNDGGSVITALTLDMSDAGKASFNNGISTSGDVQTSGNSHTPYVQLTNSGRVAGNPGYSFNNDLNTGMYQPSGEADTIAFSTNGTNRLKITNSSSDFQNQDLTGINDIYLASEIYHTGDTDTKMGFGTNNVTFTVGGTSILSVNSSHIDISGNINAVDDIFLHSAIYHAGDTDTLVSFGTDSISLRTGGSSRVTVNNTSVYIEDSSLAEDYDALSGTTPTCNVNSAGGFSLTTSGNTTFTFSGGSSGYAQGFVLQVTAGGSHTLTWPNSVDWAGGSAPDAPASGESNLYVFYTRDGGSNWVGILSAAAYG